MMMKELFTSALIEKAKLAKSAAEIQSIARNNGAEITSEEAALYFAKLHPQSGDIADEELENVAGGGCHNADGRLIVTGLACYGCEHWSCIDCGQLWDAHFEKGSGQRFCTDGSRNFHGKHCDSCGYCSAAGGFIVCNHPANHA